MKAFVTGSTGFLGNNLIRALLERGHEVRALVRSRAKAQKILGGLNLEIIEGDLDNVAGFEDALGGCDALFHTAAYFREYYSPGDHWPMLERLNVTATLQLLEAAQRAGVRRAVHTSSSGVIGVKPGHRPGDETTPQSAAQHANLYFRSKKKADDAIREFTRQSRLEVVTVFPGWMHGPGDAAPTAGGQVVLDLLARRMPALLNGGTTVADVRDVAHGMILALDRGRPSDRYILAGRYLSLEQLAQAVARASGVPAPRLTLPSSAALAVAWIMERSSAITRQPSSMTVAGVKTMLSREEVSSDKAMRELGVTFRDFDETARDAVQWFRANGYTARAAPKAAARV